MPITQEHALSHIHLLEDWLLVAQTRYEDHYGDPDQQSTTSRDPDQDSYQVCFCIHVWVMSFLIADINDILYYECLL